MEFYSTMLPIVKLTCIKVSDPAHQRYGQHLSQSDINKLVKPSDETFQQVHDWLYENDIKDSQLDYSPAKDWITIDLPVESVERLLDTKYSMFEHSEDNSYIIRTPEWSLPRHLHEHIRTIQPTNSFFRPIPKRATLKTIPSGEDIVLPMNIISSSNKLTVAEACDVNVRAIV